MSKNRKPINNSNVGEVVVGKPPQGNASLKKRKKGGCLKAFIITLCVTIGLIAVLVVSGLFIGDAVIKNNFGISLFDIFAVVGDVGDYDRDKIVTNGYSDSDVNEFYNSANSMLYFKSGENAVLDSEYIKKIMNEGMEGSDNLMASLLGILKSENFDTSKLGKYEGWKEDVDHIGELTEISDRQFAAFFDDLVFSSGMIDQMLPEGVTSMLGSSTIGDLVTLDQLIIQKGTDMSPESLTKIDGISEHAYMTFTVSLNLKDMVNGMLPSLQETTGAPVATFGWLIDWILPDMTYATATVDLNDAEYGMTLEINSLLSEECEMGAAKEEIIAKYRDANGKITKMDRLLIVIESLSNIDLRTTVNDGAANVLTMLCASDSGFSVANAIEMNTLKKTEKGNTFKMDLYGMMADLLNEQAGGNASPEDIIVLIQALICTDETGGYASDYSHRADLYSPENADIAEALASCGFDSIDDVKTEEDYIKLKAAYGSIGYKTTGASLEGHENVFEREFMKELAKAYCLDLNKKDANGTPTGDQYTFMEISSMFGMQSGSSTSSSIELTDLLDGAKFAQAAGDPDIGVLNVSDRMLGAIMLALMPEYINSTGYGDYGLDLRTLKIERQVSEDGLSHDIATVVFSLKTGEMLKEGVAQSLGGVLPEYISMGIKVDITPNLTAEQRLSAEITCYNSISEIGDESVLNGLTSDRFVDALEAIVPNLSLPHMLQTMSDGISSVVDNMTTVLPSFAFVPSPDNSGSYAEFPSLFDLAATLMGLEDQTKPEEERISGDELKSAVDYLVNYNYDDSADAPADVTYTNFLSSVQQNYYMKNQLTDFNSIFESLNGEFNASVLRLDKAQQYTYGWYNGMLYDPRSADELSVKINETDLVAIMREFTIGVLNDGTQILRADVTQNGIKLYVSIDVSTMLEAKYRNLINCDYIYGSVDIDLSRVLENPDGSFSYASVIKINDQGDGGNDFETLLRLIKAFGVEDFKLDGIARDAGKAAYDALVNLSGAKIEYKLNAEEGTIILPSFYEYAMTLLEVDDATYSAEDMKAAMQGIRQLAVNTDADKYYVNTDGSPMAANVNNFNVSDALTNPLAESVDLNNLEVIDHGAGIVGILDNQLGRWIAENKRAEGGDSLGAFIQLNALSNTEMNANAGKAFEFMNGFDSTMSQNKDYVAFTFKTDMSELFASGANLDGVLPNDVYMMLVYAYDKDAVEPLTLEYLRVNGLTNIQQNLLIKELCKFDGFEEKVTQHSAAAAKLISDLGFSIVGTGEITDSACGKFTLELTKLLPQSP